ncbi:polysaccharide biosynthesis/export family protein [Yoonia sp.]|uniref:polysaccharide biosynthesis/export family protein n=1 Tax=Yoonia sp. TaxID=2212373 RepID=UPI00358EEBFA
MIALQLIAGCAAMPGNGPDSSSVIKNAEVTSRTVDPTLGYDYALIDLSRDNIPFIASDGDGSNSTFGIASDVIPEIRLGVGDIIQLTVFESEAGGLFIPREAGVRPGNFVSLPAQEIGRNGKITVPYAGELTAAGQTPETLEANVELRLAGLAIEPQVTVTIEERNYARATVIGSVENPGRYVVGAGGERILDFIGKAGGATSDAFSTDVTLTRAGVSVTVPYELITRNPSENIYVAPGDTINVTSEIKFFYIFGASGVGEYSFNAADIDLRTALSLATGLNDGVADPSQVFIYRLEDRDVHVALGLNPALPTGDGDDLVPTIYRADFRKPDSFFMAADFEIEDGDMVYVTNARAVEVGKFFNVIRTVTGNSVAIESDVDTLSQ